MTGHLTRRELEDVVADDPHHPVPPQLRVHIAGCDRCNVRRLALVTANTRYLAAHPAEEFARVVLQRGEIAVATAPARSHKRLVIALALGVVAIAAAAALLWLGAQPTIWFRRP